MPVHLVIEDSEWSRLIESRDELEHYVQDVCMLTLRHAPELKALSAEERESLELSVALASDAKIQELNHEFRSKNAPTNVLSFPAHENAEALLGAMKDDSLHPDQSHYLGDVILGRETVEKEAKEQQKSPKDHLAHLLVHGCLHLLGHDHQQDLEAETMEALEIAILAQLSIANPYEKSV